MTENEVPQEIVSVRNTAQDPDREIENDLDLGIVTETEDATETETVIENQIAIVRRAVIVKNLDHDREVKVLKELDMGLLCPVERKSKNQNNP